MDLRKILLNGILEGEVDNDAKNYVRENYNEILNNLEPTEEEKKQHGEEYERTRFYYTEQIEQLVKNSKFKEAIELINSYKNDNLCEYYFFLLGVDRTLYPHRADINILQKLIDINQYIIDNINDIKEAIINDEMYPNLKNPYAKNKTREQAEKYVNNLKFPVFDKIKTYNYLYNKNLKQ